MDTVDWRTWLIPGYRERIVNKIMMDILKNHQVQPLISGPHGLHELKKTAERFEQIIYTEATSQLDYLRRISLKTIPWETESRKTIPSSLQTNQVGNCSSKAPDSASLDSTTAQTGDENVGDWQEEVYQKIQLLKEQYLPELNEMYQNICAQLQACDSLPRAQESDQVQRLKLFKSMMERAITFLHTSKSDIVPGYKEKLTHYEKQIINFTYRNRLREPGSQIQQGQPQITGKPKERWFGPSSLVDQGGPVW